MARVEQYGFFMNATDPTNAQFAAYRAMWAYFNAVLFGGELGHVILNFSRLARSLGFFAPERWRDGTDNVTHEISLNPAHVRRDNLKDAASTLVHEMAHAWRHGQPKPPRNGYHDVQWANKMEELGLMPSDTAAPGGARLGYKMSHYIVDGGAFERAFDAMPEACRLPWTCGIDDETRGGKKSEKEKTKKEKKEQEAARKVKVKYSCPGCALNVWGRAGLRLGCEECDQALVRADGSAVDECAAAPVRKAA